MEEDVWLRRPAVRMSLLPVLRLLVVASQSAAGLGAAEAKRGAGEPGPAGEGASLPSDAGQSTFALAQFWGDWGLSP